MKLHSKTFTEGEPIPGTNAFGVPDLANNVALSDNRNPQLRWTGAPDGTASFALICVDRDVPTKPDDVNQEGRQVPADLPRADFVHWVLVDIPAATTEVAEGEYADGIVNGGKTETVSAGREGINDYTSWFAGDPEMGGTYLGYDGPCPPWNDSIMHHYTFTIYALDMAELEVEGAFTAVEAEKAMQGHVLDKATLTGIYSLNPQLLH
ncbi:MAG: YbhB/YbcL family Raf kinase inhibitor-like protein [Acidimicrobiales bacterium]